jgi:CRP-like cAMP-binding protein
LAAHAYVDHLRSVPLFSKLSNHDLDRIASVATELSVGAGKVLLREGSMALEMFVVLDGELEVTRDGEHVATLGPGAFAGELALLAHSARTSSVTAKTPATILHIDGRAFTPLLEDAPGIAVKMLPIVAQRAVDNASHASDL